MSRYGLRAIGLIAVLSTIGIAGATTAWGLDAANTTSTTILPIFATLTMSPVAGPPGTVISVQARSAQDLCATDGGAFVAMTFVADDEPGVALSSAQASVNADTLWSADLVVPGDADPAGTYSVEARCANDQTTVFYYAVVPFDVTAPDPNSSSTEVPEVSTSSVSTPDPQGTQLDEPTIAIAGTLPSTDPTSRAGAADATLPRTGAGDPTGIAAFGVSLVGAGSLLVLSRRRRGRRTI